MFALARSDRELQALADEASRGGGTIVPLHMDIADETSRKSVVDVIMRDTDGYGLDVLVNNAGYGQMGPIEEIPPEKLRRQLEVNVVSLLAFTQPFLPGMRYRHRGRIVNVSSAAGRVATPFMGAYNASKFALEGMSDALRLELAPFGVHVILIEPGPIPTDFGRVVDQERVLADKSPYDRFYRRYLGAHQGVSLFSRTSEAVAQLIVRAVRAKRPRARYVITPAARLAALGCHVPDTLRDWVLRTVLGLRAG